jgi:hypothetical protein
MIRPIMTAFVLFAVLGIESTSAQQPATFKKFVAFKQIVPGIDFYASNRQAIAQFEKPAAEAIARIKNLFGTDLPKGAIFICSTFEQKDSIYEPMVLKMGYSWLVIANTPEARMGEVMARMKAQMGGDIPAEIVQRFKSRMPEMEAEAGKQMVSAATQQIAYGILQTMLGKDLKFRSSRIEDVGKSPLPDWIDIGIASYASGAPTNVAYLQQHMDQTFPMEDVIAMSRPFVASSSDQSGGRGGSGRMGSGESSGQSSGGFSRMGGSGQGGFPQGMPQGGFSGRGMNGGGGFPGGGFPGGGFPGGGPGGNDGGRNGRNMSKDEQDRMLFDGQASTFFSYLIEKVGIEKVKELIKLAMEGKESREFISQANVLGADFSKIEQDWGVWVKDLKAPQTQTQTQRQGF